ncbi:zinc finger CCCH domain-containing protein 19 [Tanacetum coccineum]
MDQVESVKTSKALKEIFLEFKDVSHNFIPDERCVWNNLGSCHCQSLLQRFYMKYGGRCGSTCFDMVSSLDCPVCSLVHENSSHILFSCSMALDISRLICRWWDLGWSPFGSYAEWLSWFKNVKSGNDLNIAVESGSSWIDYIGPLTSDEIDSDKRWSYRDPNGNIHGLFSLAQLRSWKDYFPLRAPKNHQIWSY